MGALLLIVTTTVTGKCFDATWEGLAIGLWIVTIITIFVGLFEKKK